MSVERVLNQRILLREVEEPRQTEGRLVKVDGEKNPLGRGKIIHRDPESKLDLQRGDSVLFDRRQALPVKVDGEELLLVHESMVYAVVNQY